MTQPCYFMLEETTETIFGLPLAYEGLTQQQRVLCDWRPPVQRVFARHQWHHMVSMYTYCCASQAPPATCLRMIPDEAILAAPSRKPAPVPAIPATECEAAYSCPEARVHDPLFVGDKPLASGARWVEQQYLLGSLLQWYAHTVLPVVLAHLADPPRLLKPKRPRGGQRGRKRPTHGTRKMMKHRVIRREVLQRQRHTVIRRRYGCSDVPPMPKRRCRRRKSS